MYSRRSAIAWAFYDWGNSAYATTVMAGFFPIFFKQYWSAGAEVAHSTFNLGLANSIASLTIALLAPVLGAIADVGSARKKFLCLFAAFGAVMTASLFFVDRGEWGIAIAMYVCASVGFLGGNIFYDSLLVTVAHESRRDFTSGLGYALGYLGGGVLFALNVWMTLQPERFGFTDSAEAVRWSFVLVALWWVVFAIPLLVWVREEPAITSTSMGPVVVGGLHQFWATFRQLRAHRVAGLFLLAYWIYIDGIDTIIVMAVDYGMALGFDSNNLIVALLITQFVGFPAALLFGWAGERLGAKRGILVGLAVYIGVTFWAYSMRRVEEFYALAVTVGLVQGGVQALSRSLFSRLIPPHQSAEFFGFYNMLGKFAAVIGPLLVGWVGMLTGDPRSGVLSLVILFVLGGGLLWRLRIPE